MSDLERPSHERSDLERSGLERSGLERSDRERSDRERSNSDGSDPGRENLERPRLERPSRARSFERLAQERRPVPDRSSRWQPEYAHQVQPPERPGPPPKRVRVVLAERKRARRVVRTLAEVEEQTGVGEMLVRQLVRSQLSVSLWLALFVAVTVGGLPLVFYYVEDLRTANVFGVRLPWLVLGVAVYPFLLGVGWLYVKFAERNEQTFVNMVED